MHGSYDHLLHHIEIISNLRRFRVQTYLNCCMVFSVIYQIMFMFVYVICFLNEN